MTGSASPVLAQIAGLLGEHRLEAVLTGNAAAALHGAPLTTMNFEFLFRRTPVNVRKLKAIARDLEAVLFEQIYPQSRTIRLMRDRDGLQVGFMSVIEGVRSFEGLRKRAQRINIAGIDVLVADLSDILKSKRAAGRPQDLAVLPALEKTVEEKTRVTGREAGGSEAGE